MKIRQKFFIDVTVRKGYFIFHLKNEYKDLIKQSINSMSDSVLKYKNLEKVRELINA